MENKSDSFLAKNKRFQLPLLGDVELKYLSLGDLANIEKLLNEKNSRYFSNLVIQNQLLKPKLSLLDVSNLEETIIQELCLKFIENEVGISRHFQEDADRNFFESFQEAFRRYFNEWQKQLEPFVQRLQSQMTALAKQMAVIYESSGIKNIATIMSNSNFRRIAENMQMTSKIAQLADYFPKQNLITPFTFPEQLYSSISYTSPAIGKYALPERIGAEVDEKTISRLLNSIEPKLEQKRNGAWQTFKGTSSDKYAQASHSMREVLRQLLDRLAPEEAVPKAPWYIKPNKEPYITRKMRVRYAMVGNSQENVSESNLELIESLANTVDRTYYKLSAEAHKEGTAYEVKTEALLKACESVLLLLLGNRFPT